MKKLLMLVSLFLQVIMGYGQMGNTPQITYQPLNSVDPIIQQFMQEELNMIIKDYKPLNKGKTVIIKYGQNAFVGKDKNLYFKYDLFADSLIGEGKSEIIKKLEISGDLSFIMNFFAKFWHTNLNSNSKEQFRFYLQDKASFYLDRKTGLYRISVINTTIKNEQQYFAETKAIKNYTDSVKNVVINEESKRKKELLEKDVKYMVYRDSLIFEASKYKISLGINQDKWNPSNEWILSMIHSTKERLNSGQNDISSQIVSVISDLIERNITPPKAKKEKKYTILPMLSNLSKKDQTPVNDDFFIADFVFKVNEGGLITDVYVANSPSNTSKNEYFNTHVQNIIQITKGLLVFPFKGQDGLNYPSVAKLTVQIWMGVKVYQTPRKGV